MGLFTKDLGAAGEKEAVRLLKRLGYRILERNYACPLGEIDVICAGGGVIVFVEVKTRTEDDAADPENNITPGKQRRMERAARHWLAAHHEPDCAYRFDAVSVVWPKGGKPTAKHIEEAFVPSGK